MSRTICLLALLLLLAASHVSALTLVNPSTTPLDPDAAAARLAASTAWPLPQAVWTGGDPTTLAQREHFSAARAPLYPERPRPVGKLLVTTPSGDRWCTATVVSTRLVLTAAQCVYPGGTPGPFYTGFVFFPAYDGLATPDPWDWQAVTIPDIWRSSGGTLPHAGTYALLELRDQPDGPIGAFYAPLGLATDPAYPNHATILSYTPRREEGEALYITSSASVRKGARSNVEYRSDVEHGAVGAPVVQHWGWPASGQDPRRSNKLFGVVSYGYAHGLLVGFVPLPGDARFQALWAQACRRRLDNCAPVR